MRRHTIKRHRCKSIGGLDYQLDQKLRKTKLLQTRGVCITFDIINKLAIAAPNEFVYNNVVHYNIDNFKIENN